jgi:hypothetical protein
MLPLADMFMDYAPPNAADYRSESQIAPNLWPRATLVWSIAFKELGNLTSLKLAPIYPEGFDPKVVKVWYPKFDDYVKLDGPWVAEWDKTFGYRQ